MIKVYIASPYTKGDIARNVKLQIDTVDTLMDKGFAPFAPLYGHFQHIVHPRPEKDWIEVDLEWIKVCDCLLRIGGESKGVFNEIALAKKLGLPVYYCLADLYDAYKIPH